MVSQINNNLGGLSFYEDETGKYVVGADSVPKKLGEPTILSFTDNFSATYETYITRTKNVGTGFSNIKLGLESISITGKEYPSDSSAYGNIYPRLSMSGYNADTGVLTYKIYYSIGSSGTGLKASAISAKLIAVCW